MRVSEAYKHNHRRGLIFSRGMKKHPTKAEKMLADALVAHGVAFKQQAYFFTDDTLYIPDFRLSTNRYKLIIEVDGNGHSKQKEYDTTRTEWLKKHRNCRVLRFTNEQVLNDIESVIEAILSRHPKMQAEINADKDRQAA